MNSSTNRPPDDSVKVGYVRRAHGIKGAAIVRVLEDEFDLFVPGGKLSTDNSGFPILTVQTAQPHREGLLVRFIEVSDRNDSETLRGTSFLIHPSDRRRLDEDEYRPEQLVGLRVTDPDGAPIGEVAEVVAGPAQDRLVVTTGSGTFDVPFVSAIVTAIDFDSGVVVLDAPDGLLDP